MTRVDLTVPLMYMIQTDLGSLIRIRITPKERSQNGFVVAKWRAKSKSYVILVPRATILLTCGRNRELWLCPTLEVRDSQTSRQIWQIWFAENMKWILCTCSENRVRSELSIPAAGQKDRGSGDENVPARALDPCLRSEGSWLWGREWSYVSQKRNHAWKTHNCAELCRIWLNSGGFPGHFLCKFKVFKLSR